jgi:hypothetical protein
MASTGRGEMRLSHGTTCVAAMSVTYVLIRAMARLSLIACGILMAVYLRTGAHIALWLGCALAFNAVWDFALCDDMRRRQR